MSHQGERRLVWERVRLSYRRRRSPHRGRRRSRPKRWLRAALLLLAAVAVLAALDAAWVVTAGGRDLRATRDRLEQGADALLAGRLGDAEAAFTLAGTSAEHAAGLLSHPTSDVAALLPWLGDDVRAVRVLADASGLAAEAGRALTDAAREAGWDGSSIPGMVSPGAVDTAAVAAAVPALDRAEGLIVRADRLLAPIETDGLLGPVADAVASARETVDSREHLVTTAARLSRLLPGFLGGEGPRTYLVVIQNLADPRGSGGYPGSYAVLETRNGRIRLERTAQVSTLGVAPKIQAPPDVAARYERFGALTHFIATTYSPDFPTSARLLMQLWQASGRPPVDGVISGDSVFMSYVLSAIGPVETPAWPVPITAENVSDVIDRDTFLTLSQQRSDRLQNAIGAALWSAVLERTPPARAFAEAVGRAARERHLQVYSADPAEERTLEALDVSGHIELGDDPLLVVWDGAVGSRVGYFVEKSVDYEATLLPDGSARVSVTVTVDNPAPDGPPSILLGEGAANDVPVGYYEAFVNVYLPRAAEQIEIRGGYLQLVEHEFGGPVVLGLIGAPSGGTASMRVSYRAVDLAVPSGDGSEYRLDVLPIPALRPDRFDVAVALPAGAQVLSRAPGTGLTGGTFTWDGAPTTPVHLWLRFSPPSSTPLAPSSGPSP